MTDRSESKPRMRTFDPERAFLIDPDTEGMRREAGVPRVNAAARKTRSNADLLRELLGPASQEISRSTR
jgi:hypothetical protein